MRDMSECGTRLLYVEHDLFLARAYIDAFTEAGFSVSYASHGEDGLRLADRIQPNLVVMEPLLPDVDSDLFGILRRFRGSCATVPIVLLTALSQREDVEQGLRFGAQAYFIKSHTRPIDMARRLGSFIC